MWSTLCFLLAEIKKLYSFFKIHMVQNSFFKYKMDRAYIINTHVNNVVSMETS